MGSCDAAAAGVVAGAGADVLGAGVTGVGAGVVLVFAVVRRTRLTEFQRLKSASLLLPSACFTSASSTFSTV